MSLSDFLAILTPWGWVNVILSIAAFSAALFLFLNKGERRRGQDTMYLIFIMYSMINISLWILSGYYHLHGMPDNGVAILNALSSASKIYMSLAILAGLSIFHRRRGA